MDSHNINWTVKTEEGQIGQSNGIGQSKQKKKKWDSQKHILDSRMGYYLMIVHILVTEVGYCYSE